MQNQNMMMNIYRMNHYDHIRIVVVVVACIDENITRHDKKQEKKQGYFENGYLYEDNLLTNISTGFTCKLRLQENKTTKTNRIQKNNDKVKEQMCKINKQTNHKQNNHELDKKTKVYNLSMDYIKYKYCQVIKGYCV